MKMENENFSTVGTDLFSNFLGGGGRAPDV